MGVSDYQLENPGFKVPMLIRLHLLIHGFDTDAGNSERLEGLDGTSLHDGEAKTLIIK